MPLAAAVAAMGKGVCDYFHHEIHTVDPLDILATARLPVALTLGELNHGN